MYEVGDMIRVTELISLDTLYGVKDGDVFKVQEVDCDGDVRVSISKDDNYLLVKSQIEKVEKEMSEFKVGDKVVMLSGSRMGVEQGEVYTLDRVDNDGTVSLLEAPEGSKWVTTEDVELFTQSKEMTFPEMAQKLIDGEFEVGTELVADNKSYFVDKANGYGLKSKITGSIVCVQIGAYIMNSKWTVKEQPIKEMSIEDIQKELGYKVKITEYIG